MQAVSLGQPLTSGRFAGHFDDVTQSNDAGDRTTSRDKKIAGDAARRGAALRENLRKRKAQKRGREERTGPDRRQESKV